METVIVLSIIAASVVLFVLHKRGKDKERQQKILELLSRPIHSDESFEVESVMRVVSESIDLVNTSKNYETVKSRLSLAIDKLQYLFGKYPHRDDIKTALETCRAHRKPVHTNALRSAVEAIMTKAKLAKTATGKTNAANRALLLLKEGLSDEFVDQEVVKKTIAAIHIYLNKEEMKEIETKAERFEFKGNYKKALDTYQDALFFLRKDDYDDTRQQEDIQRIERKIAEMEENLARPPVKTKK